MGFSHPDSRGRPTMSSELLALQLFTTAVSAEPRAPGPSHIDLARTMAQNEHVQGSDCVFSRCCTLFATSGLRE
eukprot:7742047-Pyramimonas_sp.AAC.1